MFCNNQPPTCIELLSLVRVGTSVKFRFGIIYLIETEIYPVSKISMFSKKYGTKHKDKQELEPVEFPETPAYYIHH